MKIVIDRIENDIIIVELSNGQTVNVSSLLFPDAAEGDIYEIEKNNAEASARRNQIANKMDKLFVD